MLKLVIRRRLINENQTHQILSFSSVHYLSSDYDDPPFSPATRKPRQKPSKSKKAAKEKNNKRNISNRKGIKATDEKDDYDNHPQISNKLLLKSDLPFDFRYSYSEHNPLVEPTGFREPPRFSPFGPGRLDRNWTGTCAPAPATVEDKDGEGDREMKWLKRRERVLGDPLSELEIAELVEKYRHSDCSRQINIGRDGVTHNLLDDIHNHWKRAEAVRIKCLGVPTINMDNVCFHLEDKSGGKVIYRHINVLLLYRGRNYDPKDRPSIPLMLWKPLTPIYPKLVKNVIDGLTVERTKELRNKGLNATPVMKLTRNGVYVNLVQRVRDAFEYEEVVRVDCTHVGTSDHKRIGVKLRDLVPCVPILFKDEQIILWRGKRDQEQASSSLSDNVDL